MNITRFETFIVSVPYRHCEVSSRIQRDGVTALPLLVGLGRAEGVVGYQLYDGVTEDNEELAGQRHAMTLTPGRAGQQNFAKARPTAESKSQVAECVFARRPFVSRVPRSLVVLRGLVGPELRCAVSDGPRDS